MTTPSFSYAPPSRALILASALALVAVVLAALPPWVGAGARGVLMAVFDPLCHQLPARSFHVGGVSFALCHRCFGIAVGLFAGLALAPALPFRRPSAQGAEGLLWIALGGLPVGLDVGLHELGLWTNTPASRFLSGAVFGLVAGVVIARALPRPAPAAEAPLAPSGGGRGGRGSP